VEASERTKTNIQHPFKFQFSKFQTPVIRARVNTNRHIGRDVIDRFGHWNIGASLEIGYWELEI
jgi:hypothetical protein